MAEVEGMYGKGKGIVYVARLLYTYAAVCFFFISYELGNSRLVINVKLSKERKVCCLFLGFFVCSLKFLKGLEWEGEGGEGGEENKEVREEGEEKEGDKGGERVEGRGGEGGKG